MNNYERLLAYVALKAGAALSRVQRDRLGMAIEPLLKRTSLDALLDFVAAPQGATVLAELMESIAVHKTELFRDISQLEALSHEVLRPLAALKRPLAVWSAGCATGEEVATLLVLMAEAGIPQGSVVLGTDLSRVAVAKARSLTFSSEAMRSVPPLLARRYFEAGPRGFRLIDALAARARFQRHNLMDAPYPDPEVGVGSFDLIVCRNVLIYFQLECADQVLRRFSHRLHPRGHLLLSSTEPMLRPTAELEAKRLGEAFFLMRRELEPMAVIQPVAPPPSPPAPPPPVLEATEREALSETSSDAAVEGRALFERALRESETGAGLQETARVLRKALYLAPNLVAARYMLAVALEQLGARTEASAELRRVLAELSHGSADLTGSWLNEARLAQVCRSALSVRGDGVTTRGAPR